MESTVLQAKLDNLPTSCGVYLFKDDSGQVLYIGKAKNLRSRVRSYFQPSRNLDHKTGLLRNRIRDLDYIVTDSEVEALILESTLVKRRKPLFNIHLKDDKSFLHLKLTVNEPYPRVLLTRRVKKDGALYFGPYLPASLARTTVKIINRHFLLRTCDIEIDGRLERPCLEYYIKRCLGPCVAGLCSPSDYQKAVKDVVLLLQGQTDQLVQDLEVRMKEAAEEEYFEAAAFFRDRIRLVNDLAERQKMVVSDGRDQDLFAYFREGQKVALQLFTLRAGKVVGKREFFWEDVEYFEPSEFLRDALQQYYFNAVFVPQEICLPAEVDDAEVISEWLSQKGRSPWKARVKIVVPKRGEKRKLLALVERNARLAYETRFRVLKTGKARLPERVRDELGLGEEPRRIEAFDVSNIQGAETVASMVVCKDGRMDRSEYRKFRIRGVEGPDDYSSIFEVVTRRYRRVVDEGAELPDLVLIDGGKGQLHSAFQALSQLGLEDIPLASLAKREELIFLMGQDEPLVLERRSPVLRLFQEIRDEAHRFAVSYHRQRRSIRDFESELDQIPGVGLKRKKLLLREFGSMARIREAQQDELAAVVGSRLGERIYKTLHP